MQVSAEDAMSVREAAQLLKVTEKQVQHLGRRGEVSYVARGLLDGASVRNLHALRRGRHTRGWSEPTAWAAIARLAGRDADWLGQAQVSRLRSRLRSIDAAALVAATRNRARVSRFSGHESAAGRLSTERNTITRLALPGLVEQRPDVETDWYVDARDEARLVRTYALRPDVRGRFVLRFVKTEDHAGDVGLTFDLVASLVADDEVLTALDSATSDDPRERGVAVRVLDETLERFRAHA
ncbi:MAG: hypothetical protein ABI808_14015 [Pseudonocardiales bacterium]